MTVSSVALSFRESERNWFILTGDLVVSSVATEGGWLELPLNGKVEGQLHAIPGVGAWRRTGCCRDRSSRVSGSPLSL